MFSFTADYPLLPFSKRLTALLSAIALAATAVSSLAVLALALFPA